jgi:hypothetical protein
LPPPTYLSEPWIARREIGFYAGVAYEMAVVPASRIGKVMIRIRVDGCSYLGRFQNPSPMVTDLDSGLRKGLGESRVGLGYSGSKISVTAH